MGITEVELAGLREREPFYRAMFELNTAIKLLIDPIDGAIVDANPAAERFYGWPLAALRGMNIADINVLGGPELHAEIERARVPRSTVFHFRHRLASGDVRAVDVYSGPVALGGRVFLLSIIHDVSARVALEEQLRRAQRLDAIGQLAAGVAHDFNNLLTIALASVERAARPLPPEHAAVGDLADVKRAVQQGAALTRQILAFARQQALAPQPTDLGALIRRVVAMLARVLGEHVAVAAELGAEEPPLIRIDPGQLELALVNLALNARDAMPGGGRLAFRVAPDVGETARGRVHVVVEDTGAGMDADTCAHAFDPFFTTKPPGIGTGLGLATVYGLVSQSGGQVWIDSAPGAGTRVHLLLPIAAAERAERAPRTSDRSLDRFLRRDVGAATGRARSVVVVDDRADVRNALANALEIGGLVVHAAGSATEALATVDLLGGAVDVVLSDVSMPERSGIELAADLRARWPRLPVVLMSGNPSLHPPESADGWIEKPFELEEAIAELDHVVGAMRG